MGMVIFDLDSTLADTSPRHHLSPFVDPTKTWDDYSKACASDLPILGTIALTRLLSVNHTITILTGRRISAWDETRKWLSKYSVHYNILRMRTDADPESNVEYKRLYLQSLLDRDVQIDLYVNDWPSECDDAAALGIPYILINPRYNDQTMVGWDNALGLSVR